MSRCQSHFGNTCISQKTCPTKSWDQALLLFSWVNRFQTSKANQKSLIKYSTRVPGTYLVYRVLLTKNRLQAPFVAHNYEYKRCPKGYLIGELHCWLDSTFALHWIKGAREYKQLVGNCVRKIQEHSEIKCRHVTREENPVNFASHGGSMEAGGVVVERTQVASRWRTMAMWHCDSQHSWSQAETKVVWEVLNQNGINHKETRVQQIAKKLWVCSLQVRHSDTGVHVPLHIL